MIAKTSPNRLEIKFSIPILQTIVLSTCYAFLPNVVNLLFVMATLPYFYRKKWTVFLSFLLPQLFHLFIDSRGTYLLLIYFIGYVSFASFVRLCRGNLRISMNLFQLISCVIFSIQPNQQKTVLVIMLLVQAILMGEEDEEMILFTLFLGAMGLLLYYLMPDNSEVFLILSLILICSLANVKLSCMMFFVYFLFFGISPLLFVGILLLNQLKNHRVVFVGVFLCFIAMIEMTWMEYLFSIICGGMMIALDEINTKDNKQLIRLENEHRNDLQQQLQNFSSIFENLSVYYENQSAIQSIFLKSMSKALNYTSRKCDYQRDTTFQIRREIINGIEEQGIIIEKISCTTNNQGQNHFICELQGVTKKEVKAVVDLLNNRNRIRLKIVSIHPHAWNEDTITFECITQPQIQIEAATESCFIQKESGDTTLLFQHAQSYFCVLSDGMGSGMEAQRVSRCISELLQKMIEANIHLLEAMTCINQLLQGDAYATCDVCAFDTITKSVIICKSAANPTYLVRKGELYAIWGNSLPIGIVAHIDIDHIHVQVEKGDWFIMNSDGVALDEIILWKEGLLGLSVHEEIVRFKQVLQHRQRSDDSTILLAKIV